MSATADVTIVVVPRERFSRSIASLEKHLPQYVPAVQAVYVRALDRLLKVCFAPAADGAEPTPAVLKAG